jgi:hypothetical protein
MAPQQARLVLAAIAGMLALAATFASPLSANADSYGYGIGVVARR